MKYLAIDTSSDYLCVVLCDGEKRYEYFSPDGKTRHSVSLMPAVDELFEKSGLKPSDLDYFCAVKGPGSFTGVRIGISTVKGFCYATKKPALAVTAFDLCSYNDNAYEKLCVIDACHSHYYVCGFSGDIISISPRYVDDNELKSLAEKYKVYSYSELSGVKSEKIDVVKGLIYAAEKYAERRSFDPETLSPMYLRLSQAEEGRK